LFLIWKEQLLDFWPCVWAGACAFVVGFERQRSEKSAGIRTHLLVSLGSCIFTLISAAASSADPARIAASVVNGIGFLGGGVILRDSNRVTGLTTASTVWVSAAIGMLCGYRMFFLAAEASLLTIIFLEIGRRVSKFMKASQYNWSIRLKMLPEEGVQVPSFRSKLLHDLESKAFKIINYSSEHNTDVHILVDYKGTIANLSGIIKESLPANINYKLKITAQDQQSLTEELEK